MHRHTNVKFVQFNCVKKKKTARKTALNVLWHSTVFPSGLSGFWSVVCVSLCVWLLWIKQVNWGNWNSLSELRSSLLKDYWKGQFWGLGYCLSKLRSLLIFFFRQIWHHTVNSLSLTGSVWDANTYQLNVVLMNCGAQHTSTLPCKYGMPDIPIFITTLSTQHKSQTPSRVGDSPLPVYWLIIRDKNKLLSLTWFLWPCIILVQRRE